MKRALFALTLVACGDVLVVSAVSPTSVDARGGNVVTIHGAGFTDSTEVRFDGIPSNVTIVSPTEIQSRTPALFAGTTKVSISDRATSYAYDETLQIVPLDLRYVQAPSYMVAAPSKAITAAVARDFDGDGDVDVITCRTGDLCRIAMNDGKGTFTETSSRLRGELLPTSAIVAADFDGDGDEDVFVGFGSVALGAFEINDGTASFTQAPLVTKAPVDPVSAVAAGDLDGDGKVDLVLANTVADATPLRIYMNRSASSIAFADGPAVTASFAVTKIELADVDGDGALDIIAVTPGASDGHGLHVFFNRGAAFELAAITASSATAPAAIAVSDLDGDGYADIVAAGAGQDRLFVNDGTGHFFDATVETMPLDDSPATSVAIVDLDRDRHPDLLIGNAGAVTRMYLNDGHGHFGDQSPRLSLDSQNVIALVPADVDGDGAPDLFVFGNDTLVRLFLSVEPLP